MQKQLMGVAALSAALAVADASQAQAVQWRVEDGGNGHWYAVVTVAGPDYPRITWDDARQRADSVGGHLASITTTEENAFLFRDLSPFMQNQWSCWIGGFRSSDDEWNWVTGEKFSCDSLPTGRTCPFDCCESCLYTGRHGAGPYLFVDDHDGTFQGGKNQYLVEWSADCNNDGIVDYGQCRDGTLADYNGNNVPDCCESATSCTGGQYPVQWRIEDGGNGHWYQFRAPTGSEMDWPSALDLASRAGGHLATITSPAESAWCLAVVSDLRGWWVPHTNPSLCIGPWIGGFHDRSSAEYSEPSGGWRWVTGETWHWSNWAGEQPNDSCGGEDFLHLLTIGSGDPSMTWNDFGGRCGPMPKSLLIEWSADCNEDGVIDYGQILRGQLADLNDNGIPDECEEPSCTTADLFRDFNVNGADLGILLSQWGPSTSLTVSDLNRDGVVDGSDLGFLLSFWGPCPG